MATAEVLAMDALKLLHLSDTHFGAHHFEAPPTPSGANASNAGYPTLFETIQRDVVAASPDAVLVSGDLTQSARPSEFKRASQLLTELAKLVGGADRIFVVPGNHDVDYTAADSNERWGAYCGFYNNFFQNPANTIAKRSFVSSETADAFSQVIDRSDTLGLVVVEVNSSSFVAKGSPDEHRGQVTAEALGSIEASLQGISQLNDCVRIAIIHHHPVLLPIFAEPNRQYDAVLNSGHLMRILRFHGFHAIVHGHKHYPHVFSDDSLCSWDEGDHAPLLVVAGGSAGVVHSELPNSPKRANTYNIITVKNAGVEARVVVETRSLQCFDQHGHLRLPQTWKWEHRRTIDRVLRRRTTSSSSRASTVASFDGGKPGCGETERRAVYEKLRGNMPVATVHPSTFDGQEYEVVVKISSHNRGPGDVPTHVEWSAGPKFPLIRCDYTSNPEFEARFHYYGGMLIQARIHFAGPRGNGNTADGYVYAPMPA
jgi:3',5'-cyclic AMP phosphodiesterase CpdA